MPLKIHNKYLERISVHERDNCVSTPVTYRINLAELSLTGPHCTTPARSPVNNMPLDNVINQSPLQNSDRLTPLDLLITLIPLQAIT